MTDDQLRQWIANQIANAKADRANIWKGLTVHGPQGDLIHIENAGPPGQPEVALTPRGRAALAENREA